MNSTHISPTRNRAAAATHFLVAVAVCALVIAAIYLVTQRPPTRVSSAHIATPAPVEIPAATPEPTPIRAAPQTPTPPEPVAPSQPQASAPDLETIARTPGWWPKAVSLSQAFTIPVMVNGKVAGQARLPAHTTVRLVRVIGTQVEIEHLGQRVTVPSAATDLIEQATALSRVSTGNAPAGSPQPTPSIALQPPITAPRTPSLLSTPAVSTTGPNASDSGRYRKEALEVMEDIQDRFWNRQTGLYAGSPTNKNPDTVWGAGVMFSAVVGAARNEPGKYGPVLKKFFEGLNGYWDTKAKVPGFEPAPTSGNGHDKYYDDNAWMVITFLEAYELTHSPRYHRRAEETLDFVLSGWDESVLNGGIWWHETHEQKSQGKNTCANAPAAVGCLLIAKYAQPQAARQRLEMARKITEWTTGKLQLENGLFADSIGLDGNLNRGQLTYNSALMLRAFLGLYRATQKPEYLEQARRIGRAADSFLGRRTGAYRDPVKWAHLMVEADLELYRTTKEEYLLTRASKNADHYYETWKQNPPTDLISIASIARTLWLMADTETEVGRTFWRNADAAKR